MSDKPFEKEIENMADIAWAVAMETIHSIAAKNHELNNDYVRNAAKERLGQMIQQSVKRPNYEALND